MKRILLLSMVFSFVFALSSFAQRTVSGKVTDETGEGLPGVNVVIKGTTTGVTSDLDGNYQISVPDDNTVLVYSSVGMATQEVSVGARSAIDLSMALDTKMLQEVVVTGYGIERAANEVTYQTDRVDSDLLMQGQQQVAGAGLVGKVAGMQVNVQNNGVNPQTQILLRGNRSITSNNEAMIVIDGSVATVGAFNDLNPSDIQSINVLKGANAGALYGSRASNGAVIISTKQGQYGQDFAIGVNTSVTFETVAYLPDFQTKHGIGWDGGYNAIENTNWGPRFDGVVRRVGPDFPDGYILEDQMLAYAPIEDNLRDFFETGKTVQNTVYFSGGDETGKFFMSVGNVSTDGIVPQDTYERNTLRVNASKKMGKLEFGINSTYFTDETNVVGDDIGDQDRPLYWFILNTQSNIPLSSYKDWDNPASYAHADNYYNAYYQNPYWAIGTNRDTDKTNRLVGNVYGSYEINDKLILSSRLGINRLAGTGKNWRDGQEYNEDLQPAHTTVSSFLEDSEFQSVEVNGNVLLSGNYDLSSDFSITPIVGASFIDYEYRDSEIIAVNLSIPGFYDISNGTGELGGTVDQSRKRTYGFFADVTLGYQGWAFLNLAGRQDYTSTLPEDDNSYFYPAASVSVILSDAIPSIASGNLLSFAKVTLSNATVYNDLGTFALNERFFQPDYFPYGGVNGFEQTATAVDESISKEKLNTWEGGLNLGFLNDRFSLDASLYRTKITELITSVTPSVASGSEAFLTNIGKLMSTGLELTVSGNVLKLRDFSWDANVNYSSSETIVRKIKDDLKEVALDDYGTYGTYAIVGEAFPQLKATSYVRDDQGRVVVDASTGDPLIGTVDAHGKTTPDYIIGATNKFSYKGISLSATVDYRTGHIYFSQGSNSMEFTGKSKESVSANRQDFVFPNSSYDQGDGTFVENNSVTISNGVMGFWQNVWNDIKENYVKDATAFKVREVALSYTLPSSVTAKTGFLKSATVGFVGRNIFTKLPEQNRFSDPEFRNTRSTDDENGIGIGGYLQSPPTRSFGFSLNVEF
ncbi:MAG: SusC/RagA family TonB-linked outer membrane protein [Cytophagales bacterium]|nr:SusC/RagA family TonB-linked outer membrane protein [Cytophagales bacterium]